MAAAKLCCTTPLRSHSPDDTPPRPVRPFKSLANIKTHFAHNKHTPDTTDDHTQGNYPLYPADDLELRRIFVAASLPEDHPHALKIRHRKPEVNESIIHSPSFTNKLRRQLSRKSLATDKFHKDTSSKLTLGSLVLPGKRLAHGLPELAGGYDDDAQSLCLTGSRLASLANDSRGMMDARSVQHARSSEPLNRSDIALDEPRRSVSVPLASYPADSSSKPRRSLSSDMQQEFKGVLSVHLPGPTFMDADDMWQSPPTDVQTSPAQLLKTLNSTGSQLATSKLSSSETIQPQLIRAKSRSTDKHKVLPRDSTNSLHLYDMQISQHLRTRSQVSEASSASEPDRQNRHTHASLNSIVLSSMGPGRCKSISSSGFADSAGPSTWEKVLEDESSSIYSRRPSTALDVPLVPLTGHTSDLSHKSIQGRSIASDMSKHSNQSKENTFRQAERVISVSTGISFVASGSVSHPDLRESASVSSSACVNTWPDHKATCSLPKSDSSGSLGKLSKFKEDLNDASTVPKSRKKRRSVLRMLFPGLTRSKLRSTSTPLLGGRTQSSLNQTYDGTGDAQDFLSVPQSSSKPQGTQRAASFADNAELRPASARSISSLAATPSLQSRQSLVDYERSLSIVGDNRRRKSTLGGPKMGGNADEDQGDYPERTLRRVGPLLSPSRKGTEEALMEKALLQHQAEKSALLRPSNLKIETAPTPRHAPVFTSPFGFQSTSEARLTAATLDELDPLEAEEPQAVRKSQSMQDLTSSEDVVAQSLQSRGKKRSTIWTMDTAITKGTRSHLRAVAPPHSWSQYPSHTRERRCSSAGRHDGIICRDFAHGQTPCNIDQAVSVETTKSHQVWPRLVNSKRRNWIAKSRSMTFGTVFRYYSNLLTSSAARNRRSSTATGGRLEHPELEVLPPVLPVHPMSSAHSGLEDQFSRSTDHQEAEGHDIKDGLGFLHHRSQKSTSSVNRSPSEHAPTVPYLYDGSQSLHSQAATDLRSGDHFEDMSILPDALDGNVEDKPAEPDRALSARRLSRMYQAYVQLPTSLNNTEMEQNGAIDESSHTSDEPTIAESPDVDSKMSTTAFLTVPSPKERSSSGPITRRFPSVTVIDDRKGHWRSVSLLSVDSGRSIRKSTRDLLEVVRATQTQELAKLLNTSETSITDANTLNGY